MKSQLPCDLVRCLVVVPGKSLRGLISVFQKPLSLNYVAADKLPGQCRHLYLFASRHSFNMANAPSSAFPVQHVTTSLLMFATCHVVSCCHTWRCLLLGLASMHGGLFETCDRLVQCIGHASIFRWESCQFRRCQVVFSASASTCSLLRLLHL
jgi:hypothetical protein